MNLKRYSDKLPVYVSAGILISGMFWFLREDEHIRGEDVAELRAAVEERRIAMRFNYDMTSSFDGVSVVYAKVIEDTSGGNITILNGLVDSPVEFTADNYFIFRPVGVRVDADAPTGSYFEAAWYLDGNIQTGRMIVSVGAPPPGGPRYMGSIGDLTLNWRRLELWPGADGDNYVRLNEAPRRREREALVTERITKAQVYDDIMTEARDMATASGGALPVIMWLADDVEDGDVLTAFDAMQWTVTDVYTNDYDGATHTFYSMASSPSNNVIDFTDSTSTRTPFDGGSFMPGISATNAPFAQSLYGSINSNTHAVASGLGRWWTNTVGNGGALYRYGCEDTNGNYQAWKITRQDLDQSANVLANLNRTIALVPTSFFNVEKNIRNRHYYEYLTNYVPAGETMPNVNLQTYWDAAKSAALASTSTLALAGWDGTLGISTRKAFWEAEKFSYEADWEIDEIRAAALFDWYFTKGAISDYPSAYALTNGMVARVRVFACVVNECSTITRDGLVGVSNRTDVAISGDYSETGKAASWGLVGVSGESATNAISALPLLAPTVTQTAHYIIPTTTPAVFTLRLLADIVTPTEPAIAIEFGNGINVPEFKTTIKRSYVDDIGGGLDIEYVDEYWGMYVAQYVFCFAIVVDWNFAHLTDTPYVPTPHTPEWLSTNTP
jgi:hypothetical protein